MLLPLSREYRGEVLDLIHIGNVCVVDKNNNVIHSVGDVERPTCYRSASKPLQALPVIALKINKKYGISENEAAIFSGSHTAEKFHVEALESVLKKAGLNEEDMIMLPCYPQNELHKSQLISTGGHKRKIYHNCSGKHIASMLLQRELGGDVRDYWKPDSLAQKYIKDTICKLSQCDDALVSLDGCGVPVYTVALKNIAIAYKNLAFPKAIKDLELRKAVEAYIPTLHENPLMMRGTGFVCSLMNMEENIIAKGGANGVYGFGLKKEKLGIAFKLADGTEDSWPLIILQILKDLNALSPQHEERLMSLHPYEIYNDNKMLAGRREAGFELKRGK